MSFEPCNRLDSECAEARSELARHHRDFERISDLVHEALDSNSSGEMMQQALETIRGIVG